MHKHKEIELDMKLPVQVLELARFATLGDECPLSWMSIRPFGEAVMQATALTGASLAQYAWIDVGHDKREVCIRAEDILEMLKASYKKDRLLGATLEGNVLQIGNELGKPVRVVPHAEVHFPDTTAVIPEEGLEEDSGPQGSIFGLDLRLVGKVQEWLRNVNADPIVKWTTRGPHDPIRLDVPTINLSGGSALFVIMPARIS